MNRQQQTCNRRIMLVGFYGRGNFGDDAMCSALTHFLEENDRTHITIISSEPGVQKDLASPRVEIMPRRLRTVISSLWKADIVCQGGGTIFHDSYKGKYLLHYWLKLMSWLLLFWAARVMGARVVVAGAGIGPLRHRVSRWFVRAALAACDCIGVRDKASLEMLYQLHANIPHYLGFDLSLLVNRRERGTMYHSPKRQHVLGISACSLTPFLGDAQLNRQYWWALGDALELFAKDYPVRIIFFSLFTGTSSESDDTATDLIVSRFPKELMFERRSYNGQVEAFAAQIAECDWFLGTKYHAAVAAYEAGCEFAVVAYNQKVSYFADEIGLPHERRIEAGRVQSVDTWLNALKSLADREQGTSLVSPVEAASRARCGLTAVLEEAYKLSHSLNTE